MRQNAWEGWYFQTKKTTKKIFSFQKQWRRTAFEQICSWNPIELEQQNLPKLKPRFEGKFI